MENIFNTSWNDYATSPAVDQWIQKAIRFNGLLYIFAAYGCWCIRVGNRRYFKIPIYVGAGLLIVLSILAAKEKFYHYGQFFEHAVQFGLPILLIQLAKEDFEVRHVVLFLKIFVALTFTAHGLYALGYYPVPGEFIDMCINSTGMSENIAVVFLYMAGILDIMISFLIFIPKVSGYALLYAGFWGLASASARLIADFNPDFVLDSLHQSFYRFMYRLPPWDYPHSTL